MTLPGGAIFSFYNVIEGYALLIMIAVLLFSKVPLPMGCGMRRV